MEGRQGVVFESKMGKEQESFSQFWLLVCIYIRMDIGNSKLRILAI